MITREADYAIRTIVYLARHFGKAPIATTEVSEKMEIPYRFSRKISHKLVESGIVGTVRGKQGGIFLIPNPEQLSLLDILKIFDYRTLHVNACCYKADSCSRSGSCSICKRLLKLQEKMHTEFASIKFSEL